MKINKRIMNEGKKKERNIGVVNENWKGQNKK